MTSSISKQKKLKKNNFDCDYCGKSMAIRKSFIYHVRNHEKTHVCGICEKKFPSDHRLKLHEKIHTGEKPYKCKICSEAFAVNRILNTHIRTHTGEKPYECEICAKSFLTKGSLVRHQAVHVDEKPYKCNDGFIKSEVKNLIMKEYPQQEVTTEVKTEFPKSQKFIIVNQLNSLNCQVCNLKFDSIDNFNAAHCNYVNLECIHCNKIFSSKTSLMTHVFLHTGEKPYKCGVCNKGFAGKGDLTKHVRLHTNDKPFKCKICQKGFIAPHKVTIHMRYHTGERPFKCDACSEKFLRKDMLLRHLKSAHTHLYLPFTCNSCNTILYDSYTFKKHSCFKKNKTKNLNKKYPYLDKTFKCNTCNKDFRSKRNLIEHIRSHTGEKPYKCEACNKGFARKGDFKLHLRIHTGEKPYKCKECNKAFRLSNAFTAHIKTHMKVKPNKRKNKRNEKNSINKNPKNDLQQSKKIKHSFEIVTNKSLVADELDKKKYILEYDDNDESIDLVDEKPDIKLLIV